MKVGVPREILPGEHRVAVIPDTISKLGGSGFEFLVESGAGAEAYFPDAAYEDAGARVVGDARTVLGEARVVLKVRKPVRNEELAVEEVDLISEGAVLIGLLEPLGSADLARRLAERRISSFSLELVPRISRAQKMDALSSQSSVAGYRASLIAATSLSKFFPMMMTAAGTVPPAKVLVLGAGVAGLQAIATCRRLGAVVQAYDIRPAVKEEVESLGAKFLEQELGEEGEGEGGYAKEVTASAQERQREFLHEHVQAADVVITTAAVPGRKAPVLVEEEMVRDMRPGSVIVDLAAEAGGNCALTEAGAEVVRHGVIIHGPVDLPASMAIHASQMYSRNITSLLTHLAPEGELKLDFEDEVVRDSCVTHDGEIVNDRVRELVARG